VNTETYDSLSVNLSPAKQEGWVSFLLVFTVPNHNSCLQAKKN